MSVSVRAPLVPLWRLYLHHRRSMNSDANLGEQLVRKTQSIEHALVTAIRKSDVSIKVQVKKRLYKLRFNSTWKSYERPVQVEFEVAAILDSCLTDRTRVEQSDAPLPVMVGEVVSWEVGPPESRWKGRCGSAPVAPASASWSSELAYASRLGKHLDHNGWVCA